MNLANQIKKAANAEGLTYWDYVKKHQNSKRFGFRYVRVNVAASLERDWELKETRRKRKYGNQSFLQKRLDNGLMLGTIAEHGADPWSAYIHPSILINKKYDYLV